MNQCIFVFRFKLDEKQKRVIQVLTEFHALFKIEKISSVFKKNQASALRLDEELAFAILTSTKIEVDSILSEKNKLSGPDFKVEIVTYNNQIQWAPDLALPSPLLNFDPLVLHCCAEILPNYIHPILKEKLKTLDINNLKTDFEFLFQGKIYIDQLA